MEPRTKPEPVDVHVGSRLRLRRTLLKMSQSKLGNALNLTFQQIQKYERGANRIGSSRLYRISQILDVPISFFFDDMPQSVMDSGVTTSDVSSESIDLDLMTKKDTLELVQCYYSIEDSNVRKKVYDLVKSLAD